MPEGTAVEVTGGTVGEWQPVNCNGVSGYVHASFISWDAPVAAAPVDLPPRVPTDVRHRGLGVPTEPQQPARRQHQ